MRRAKTTRTASATQPPGFSQNAVGSAVSGVSATAAAINSALDIELRLYRRSGVLLVDGQACDPPNHVLSGLRRDGFDLGTRRCEAVANLRLGCFDLEVDLVRGSLDLRLRVAPAFSLRILRDPGR